MFDPDAGAAYAAQFLKSLYAERGDWSAAAGAYHSQTPERAGVYRARFDRILAGLSADGRWRSSRRPSRSASTRRRPRRRRAGRG